MTDIFTLINQLPDDDIRLQLAFFDSVTLTSAAKETGSRLLSGFICTDVYRQVKGRL